MNPALLVIDVQKGIDEAQHWGGNRNNPEAEGNIKLLLDFWRTRKFPVIIVQHCSTSEGSPFHPSRSGNSLKDFIFANEGEVLIRKSTANAFIKTGLEDILRKRKIAKLVVTGFVTNNSVEATARMSGELGFATTVISDATASFSNKGVDGTVFPSELIHQISLCNLNGEYAEIKTTQEVISVFKT
jgi:nicotinamidase-related amidase